jgi:hypothetical protein
MESQEEEMKSKEEEMKRKEEEMVADGSQSRVCESEPRHRIRDECKRLHKHTQKNKGSRMGQTKKIFQKEEEMESNEEEWKARLDLTHQLQNWRNERNSVL